MIPSRTESFHFSRLVNSATKIGAQIQAPILFWGWVGGGGGGGGGAGVLITVTA